MTEADHKLVQEAVRISEVAIQEEFIRLPGDLAYWNQRHADARKAAMLVEHERKTAEARKQLEIRAAAKATGEKLTVGEIEAQVVASDDYQKAVLREIDADCERELVRGVVDAIHAKKDSLVSLGAHLRLEMQGDPSIRDDERRRRMERVAVSMR